MKEMIKDLLKSITISIGIAFTIFCMVGMIVDVTNYGAFSLEGYQFTKMVLGCMVVGVGFGAPSVIYNSERLPMPIKVLIHMGTGCVVYTMVAFVVGWIDTSASVAQIILVIAIQLSVAFAIWIIFMLHYRKEATIMNRRIQELKKL